MILRRRCSSVPYGVQNNSYVLYIEPPSTLGDAELESYPDFLSP